MQVRLFLSAAGAAAFLAFGPALAADASPEFPRPLAAPPAADREGSVQIVDDGLWFASSVVNGSELIGADVVNESGEPVGEIEDLLLNVVGGNPNVLAIVSLGEGFAIGGTRVMVQLDEVEVQHQHLETDDVRIATRMTNEQLRRLPQYEGRER